MATSPHDRLLPPQTMTSTVEIERLFANTWMLVVNVINAAIVASILWGQIPGALLLGWLATMTLIVTGRIAMASAYAREPAARSPAQWAHRHAIGSGITGLTWGATGVVPLLASDPVMHVMIAITAAGMGAGALVLSFVHLPSFRAFVLSHSVPVVLGIVAHGGSTYLAIAAMALVFIAVLDRIGSNLNLSHLRTQALQAQLIESERRMRDFAEAASHWLWETDSEGRYTMASEGFSRVTGLLPELFMGRKPAEIATTDLARAQAVAEIGRRMEGRKPFMDLRVPFPLPDGPTLTLAVSGKPIFDAQGAFLGYRGITRDVTEQSVAESAAEEMRRARDLATAADELKTRFLASVSHELRTPLNAVIGFSEMMNQEMLGPIGTPVYKGYAANIRDSGRHLLDLINDLLDMSRIELGHYRISDATIALHALVTPCTAMVRATIPHDQVVIDDARVDRDIVVRADPRAMRQVLINLLANASRAAPPGSAVLVSAAIDATGDLVITVSDSGPGIPPEELEAVFQPFSAASADRARRHGGTGLGLWISRSLVEAHGGTLALDSDGRQGTRATIRLPSDRLIRTPEPVATIPPLKRASDRR